MKTHHKITFEKRRNLGRFKGKPQTHPAITEKHEMTWKLEMLLPPPSHTYQMPFLHYSPLLVDPV